MTSKPTFKMCNRGHEYTGAVPCSICWPGRNKNAKEKIPSTFENHQVVKRNSPTHKAWALEAAKKAKQVLLYFERERPDDVRPRIAIEAIKSWAQGKRKLGLTEVRKLSLDSHAAARASKTNAAKFAARAAGQSIAIWHVPTHATAVPKYAQKAILAYKE